MEDYDEAMRLKDEIIRLQGVSRALAELERSKRMAVEEEDYPRAKALKEEIHRLRSPTPAQQFCRYRPLRTNGATQSIRQPPYRQSQTAHQARQEYYHQNALQTPLSGVSGRSTPLDSSSGGSISSAFSSSTLLLSL